MKKVFDQTVRDIKREVNKKVLKVPGIEQKVLDATSNEPWGPHGSLLADIALATRNYHEYQMIMSAIWKRLSDTGKNWRHVYKALIILEYMVAHGSERVIDDIKEHAYQISTLSDFQYIDSSGRDQGSNVRKKSQSLVALVNDKERIIEVRQKAAANRDKFRNTSVPGGMYRPGSYSSTGAYGDRYDDDRYEGRYGGREEERNGYGREREWGSRDDDRYGKIGDSYSRDGDRYGREYDERNDREGYQDDDYQGRSRSVDDYNNGSRSRSSDRERERAFDDDGQYSSRGSGARADDESQDGRLSRKFSEQNIGAPPSYEELVSESRSPVQSGRDGEIPNASVPRAASPPASTNPSQATSGQVASTSPAKQEVEPSDEFDPRGSVLGVPFGSPSAAPLVAPAPPAPAAPSNNVEMDLLGSLSDSFSSNQLAIVPTTSPTTTFEADAHVTSSSATAFVATPSESNVMNQSLEDPFGDSPFKAFPSTEIVQSQPETSTSTDSFPPTMNHSADTASNFPFGDSFSAVTYSASGGSSVRTPSNSQFLPQELSAEQNNTDILADILPPSGPSPAMTSQPPSSVSAGQRLQPTSNTFGNFHPQQGSVVPHNQTGFAGQQINGGFPSQAPQAPREQNPQFNSGNFMSQPGGFSAPTGGNFFSQQGGGSPAPIQSYMATQTHAGPASQFNGGNFQTQHGSASPVALQAAHQSPTSQHHSMGNLFSQAGSNTSMASQQPLSSSTGTLAIVPQPSKDKFETKSAVWADTLSRGLVNLNISGAKINPLNDIGIDFDAINRKEKRMEKQPAVPATSTVNMGKAMGSGSGIGRAGASVLRAPPNAMMGSGMGGGMGPGPGIGIGMGMGMGMGGGPGGGMGMRGYGGMNQHPMGGMGMGMNVSMGMQGPNGLPPGSNMPGGYNPMMGTGGYPQQPYGG